MAEMERREMYCHHCRENCWRDQYGKCESCGRVIESKIIEISANLSGKAEVKGG